MKRHLARVSALFVFLMLASCGNDGIYSGFEKMKNGAYMKFYSKGNSGVMPRLKDEVTFEMVQYFNDSLLFTTVGAEPMRIVLSEPDFVGDVADGLMMMHVGDSARLVVIADSVFSVTLQMEEIPEEYAGKPIYYDLKLLSVKPFEELEAERKALLDSLQWKEEEFLASVRNDAKNTLTESGIIVMEKTGKGRVASMGDYVDFDFTMCDSNGDTIMNSFSIEPVEIPSALAFDSTGYEKYILPYTTLVVRMKMNHVMDKAAYEKRQAALEAEKEAERERMMALESKTIADYIKSNGIVETPTESGLYIIRQEEGEGDVAQWGDEVGVHYVLKNLNDEQLDSSYDYERPMYFKIGSGQMIPAIEEAVMTMAPGEKVTLITPSSLAFGEFDMGETLPPYSPLKIELELVEVK